MKIPGFLFILLWSINAFAQLDSNGPFIHSHNDYEQKEPLIGALNSKAKSIEIDVFLHNKELIVAHTKSEIKEKNTLENLYILPLQKYLKKTQNVHDFHFLIDIKSESGSTLKLIETVFNKYPGIFSKDGVQIIISGNRPKAKNYTNYSEFIWFDGRDASDAQKPGGERIAMISQNLSKFTRWRGEGEIPAKDKSELLLFIEQCHQQNKPVRLWNTGDSEEIYKFLQNIGVDYLNTDNPKALRTYLNTK